MKRKARKRRVPPQLRRHVFRRGSSRRRKAHRPAARRRNPIRYGGDPSVLAHVLKSAAPRYKLRSSLEEYAFKTATGRYLDRSNAQDMRHLKDAWAMYEKIRDNPRRRRRRNPLQAPAVQHFIFARRGGGQRLHYNGEKFTTNGKPAYFTYKTQAETIARELIRKFPVLRTYDVYVGDTSRKH